MTPILCHWDGEAMRPLNTAWAKRADQEFVVGERYQIAAIEERSAASHNHYFAALAEAHANLPEEIAERFSTVDHLRRYALIRTGYRDERSIVCASKAEAQRVAAFIRPMDSYAIVTVSEAVVMVWAAKSQSKKAMGKQTFGESKEAVLNFVATLIGVNADDLKRAVA